MLRLLQRNCALVVLSSTLFWGSAFPALAGVYRADGSAGHNPPQGLGNGETYSTPDLGVQAGGGVTYDPFPGMHAAADSLADGYGVRSHTYAQLAIPSTFGAWTLSASSSATAIFSDMVVSGPVGGAVTTSLNMELSGNFLFGSASDPGARAIGEVQAAVFIYINGAFIGGGGDYERQDSVFGPFSNHSGMLATWGPGNPIFLTPDFQVQSGVPFDVQIQLSTFADAIVTSGNSTGGTAEANSDFSHTFFFASSGPVFNLPIGFTANSADAHIVANQVSAVPVPSSLALAAGAMGLFSISAWRRSKRG